MCIFFSVEHGDDNENKTACSARLFNKIGFRVHVYNIDPVSIYPLLLRLRYDNVPIQDNIAGKDHRLRSSRRQENLRSFVIIILITAAELCFREQR